MLGPGHVIDRVFAFVTLDDGDGNEGVPAFSSGPMMYPLIGCDRERLGQLHEIAARMVETTGMRIELREFRLHQGHGFVPVDLDDVESGDVRPSASYYVGVRDGIRAHAIWKDGQMVVGALQQPIAKVLASVDEFERQGKRWDFG